MPWRKAWIQGTVGYAINAAKEGKAPGRCGIPAEIWKHTWPYETRHLDFLRREKFCSKARFKQQHTTANFPCAQGTFYLTNCGSPRRGITWRLHGAPDPQLLSFGLWLVSDLQWTQSCYWVDKLLAPYTHLHKRTCPSWCGKTTTDRLEHFDRQRARHSQLLGCPLPPSISFGY